MKGRTEIPGIVEGECFIFPKAVLTMVDYMKGTLWVDEFVSHHRPLEEISQGFDDMHVSLSLGMWRQADSSGRRLHPLRRQHGLRVK